MSDFPRAHAVKALACDCPAVHIVFVDSEDMVLAAASMPPATARLIAADLSARAEEAELAARIGKCEGHA